MIKYQSRPPVNLIEICNSNTYHTRELKATYWNRILSAVTANRSLTLTFKKNPVPLLLNSWYIIPATNCAPVKPMTDARAMLFASWLMATVQTAAAAVRKNSIVNNSSPLFFSCIKQRQIKSNGINKKLEIIKPGAPKCFTIRFAETKAIRKSGIT